MPQAQQTQQSTPIAHGEGPSASVVEVKPVPSVFFSRAVSFLIETGMLRGIQAAHAILGQEITEKNVVALKKIAKHCSETSKVIFEIIKDLHQDDVPISDLVEFTKRYGDGFVSLYTDLFEGTWTRSNFSEFRHFEREHRSLLERVNSDLSLETPRVEKRTHLVEMYSGFKAQDVESDPELFRLLVLTHGSGASSLYRAWGEQVETLEALNRHTLQGAGNSVKCSRKDILAAVCEHLPTPHDEPLIRLIMNVPANACEVLNAMPKFGFTRDPEKYVAITERFKGFAATVFDWFGEDCSALDDSTLQRLSKMFGATTLNLEESAALAPWQRIELKGSLPNKLALVAQTELLLGACGPHLSAFYAVFQDEYPQFFARHGKDASELVQKLEAVDLDLELEGVIRSYPWTESRARRETVNSLITASDFNAEKLVTACQEPTARQHPQFAEMLIRSLRGHAATALTRFPPEFVERHPDLARRTAETFGPYFAQIGDVWPQRTVSAEPEKFSALLDMYGKAAWGLVARFKENIFVREEELRPLLHQYCGLTTGGAGDFFFRVPEALWDTPKMKIFARRYEHATGAEYYSRSGKFSFNYEDELWERSFAAARRALNVFHPHRYCTGTQSKIDTCFLDQLVLNETAGDRRHEEAAVATFSAYDHNFAFSDHEIVPELKAVNRRMNLRLREVKSALEIVEHFERSAEKQGTPNRLGMLFSHGFSTGVACYRPFIGSAVPRAEEKADDDLTVAQPEYLARIGRTMMTGGDFIFASCLAAYRGFGADNLVTGFKSAASHVNVYAARTTTSGGFPRFATLIDSNKVVDVDFSIPHRKKVFA